MKKHQKTKKEESILKIVREEPFLKWVLILDVILLFWLVNFDKVIQFISWVLGK